MKSFDPGFSADDFPEPCMVVGAKVDETMELKPCPFCGGEATLGHHIEGGWFVSCNKCPSVIDEWAKEEAIAAWNRRTTTETVSREVKKVFLRIWETLEAIPVNNPFSLQIDAIFKLVQPFVSGLKPNTIPPFPAPQPVSTGDFGDRQLLEDIINLSQLVLDDPIIRLPEDICNRVRSRPTNQERESSCPPVQLPVVAVVENCRGHISICKCLTCQSLDAALKNGGKP